MTIIYNTNHVANPNAYLTLAVAEAARGLWGEDNVFIADNRTLLPAAASGEHDTLICIDGQRLNNGVIQRARPSFRTTILWLFEDPFMLDYNRANASLFDHVFTNDPSCVPAYGGKGHYLPLAASPRLHRRTMRTDEELEYDIFFAGTMWPNRVPVIRGLIAAFPDARFKLICPTNEYLPPLPSDLAERAIQRPVSHEAFIDFANASRVSITLFRDYPSHGNVSQATAPGPRLYEVGLAGTAQVVECPDEMDNSHFATVRGVLVTRGREALHRAVSDLLSQPALRSRYALQTQHAVQSNHLYTHRLQTIAEVAGLDDRSHRPKRQARAPRLMRVLMCTHSTMREREWGGVEVYQQTICSMLAGQAEVYFWLRRDGNCRLVDAGGSVLERFDGPDVGWLDSLCDAFEETTFASVLGQYDFDLVHFQHLGHHTASLPMIAKSAGLGTVFSVHDFFLVCSRYHLLNYEQRYCDIGNHTITACDVCLRIAEQLPTGVQETRRGFMNEVLESIDALLFGSRHSEELLLSIYPHLTEKHRAILGIPTPAESLGSHPQRPPKRRQSDRLVIAVLGNFTRAKGADAALNVMESANPELFEFQIWGKADAQYAEMLTRWDKPNVTYYGRYAPGDLDALGLADVSLHLSIWPETFCIALSEAWQAGLVPIVTDIGALGERVADGVNGFKVPVGDVSSVLNRLEMLRVSPQMLEAMRSRIGPHLWADNREYAEALLQLYRSVTPKTVMGTSNLHLDVGQLHLLPHASWKQLAPPRHIFDPPRPVTTRLELPPGIRNWTSIQGSQFYIEAICEVQLLHLSSDTFTPSDEFRLDGWTFIAEVGVAGQVYVALIGVTGSPVIFVPSERVARDDVPKIFPGAPIRTGFTARTSLRGRWSDGSYRVGLVNTVGDRAGFQLTGLRIRLFEGRVTEAEVAQFENDDVLNAFAAVAAQVPLSDRAAVAGEPDQRTRGSPDSVDSPPVPTAGHAVPEIEFTTSPVAAEIDPEPEPAKRARPHAAQERNGRRKISAAPNRMAQ